ncbi:carboxypeptidase-like regulatory domain-containing protein [Paludibaculum fermentans]|uniref:Carboxypeptidase regulatory-like domain-containing protein n=1 Tax=Paludibaculum fermentans TaxID=1473598 RepID=A0A7S7SPA0_PALFE|nr:carboxypeptidase-like regulatory domain-containing protein [Paludibaculum fermentans]QOY91371.1 carboxypeptidase regulatory-like domain-containing protein [Paludibaculum fermentans]
MTFNLPLLRLASALIAFGLGAEASQLQPAQFTFAGKVSDLAGSPVAGAVIKIEPIDHQFENITIHAKNGRYVSPPLPDGAYALTATAPGFLTVSYSQLKVAFPRTIEFDITLRTGPVLEGEIGAEDPSRRFFGVLQRDKLTISGAKVCLRRGESVSCSLTNSLGQYFLKVSPGVYSGTVEVNGEVVFSSQLDLGAPGQYQNRIRLK